jgi:hypothetical protein
MVDLQSTYGVGRVVLNWETAFSSAYRLEGSLDGSNWSTLYETASGAGGVEEVIFPATDVRYVRLYSTARATKWGVSLWEFEVYGDGGSAEPPVLTSIAVAPDGVSVASGGSEQFTAEAEDQYGSPFAASFTWSVSGGGSIDASGLFTADTVGGPYTVTAEADSVSGTAGVSVFDPSAVEPTTNLALNRPVTASSLEKAAYPADQAVDGDPATRWSSARSDPQWLMVDLQSTYGVDRVVLSWETAFSSAYRLEGSLDGNNWGTLYETASGTGGVEEVTFPATDVRYVRLYSTARATKWGVSLWEFEVYGG